MTCLGFLLYALYSLSMSGYAVFGVAYFYSTMSNRPYQYQDDTYRYIRMITALIVLVYQFLIMYPMKIFRNSIGGKFVWGYVRMTLAKRFARYINICTILTFVGAAIEGAYHYFRWSDNYSITDLVGLAFVLYNLVYRWISIHFTKGYKDLLESGGFNLSIKSLEPVI